MKCHEVDYHIIGHEMQVVEVGLDPNETVIAEAGAMNYFEDGIAFEAKMGGEGIAALLMSEDLQELLFELKDRLRRTKSHRSRKHARTARLHDLADWAFGIRQVDDRGRCRKGAERSPASDLYPGRRQYPSRSQLESRLLAG